MRRISGQKIDCYYWYNIYNVSFSMWDITVGYKEEYKTVYGDKFNFMAWFKQYYL